MRAVAVAGLLAVAALAVAGPARAGTGDLVVTDSADMLIEVDSVTGHRTLISDNANPPGDPEFGIPLGLMADGNGDFVVAGYWNIFNTGVWGTDVVQYPGGERDQGTFSLTGSNYNSPSSGPSFGAPWGVAVDADGDFLVADQGLRAIIEVNKANGDRTIVSDNSSPGTFRFVSPFDVDVLPDGDLVVTDPGPLCAVTDTLRQCGVVFRVDPTSGERFVLASNKTIPQVPSSQRLDEPQGLAVDPVTGDILVANHDGENILRVDSTTGDKTLVSDNTEGGTATFVGPRDLATDGDDIYVTDAPSSGGSSVQVVRVASNGSKHVVSRNGSPSDTPDFVGSIWGIDIVPVSVTGARSSPGTFAPETTGERRGMFARSARGTTFRYRLGEAARTTFTLWRRHAGRIQNHRCRPPSQRNRRGRACVRWRQVGRFTHRGRRGSNAVRFSGRLRRGGALPAGRYRAIVVARNARGVRSQPVAVPFRVLRG